MSKKYVENNLIKNEVIVKKAERNGLYLFWMWFWAILRFWMLLIPIFQAIFYTIEFFHADLAVTNKRVIGRSGLKDTSSVDVPLNKVQNVNVKQPFWGKVFNYGTIVFESASEARSFVAIKNPDAFKRAIMAQVEEYEEERMKQQAAEMANAMAGVLNK